jgi:hypothetical protein
MLNPRHKSARPKRKRLASPLAASPSTRPKTSARICWQKTLQICKKLYKNLTHALWRAYTGRANFSST